MSSSGLPSPGVLFILLGITTGIGATLMIPGERLLSDLLKFSGDVITVYEDPGSSDCRSHSVLPGICHGADSSRKGGRGSGTFLKIGFPPGITPVNVAFETWLIRKIRIDTAGTGNTGIRSREASPGNGSGKRAGSPGIPDADSFSGTSPGVLLGEFLADQALELRELELSRRYPLKGLPLPEKRHIRAFLEKERKALPGKVLDSLYGEGAVLVRTDSISAVNRLRLLGVYAGMVCRILKNDLPAAGLFFLGIILDAGITRCLKLRDGYLPVPRRYRLAVLGASLHIGAVPVLLIPFLLPPFWLPAVFGGWILVMGVCLHVLIINLSARPESDLLNQE